VTTLLRCDGCAETREASKLPAGWTVFVKSVKGDDGEELRYDGLGHYCPRCNGNDKTEKKRKR
jgi:hypothetical protein